MNYSPYCWLIKQVLYSISGGRERESVKKYNQKKNKKCGNESLRELNDGESEQKKKRNLQSNWLAMKERAQQSKAAVALVGFGASNL